MSQPNMAPRRNNRKGKSTDQSTPWSDWTLHEENYWYQCRYNSAGEEEWRYPDDPVDSQGASDPQVPRSQERHVNPTESYYSNAASTSSNYSEEINSEYTTTPAPGEVYGTILPQSVNLTSKPLYSNYYTSSSPNAAGPSDYISHNEVTQHEARPGSQGSLADSVATVKPSMTSMISPAYNSSEIYGSKYTTSSTLGPLDTSFQNLGLNTSPALPGADYTFQPAVESQDPHSSSAQRPFGILDPRYEVKDPKKYKKFWKVGRVFLVLWTEPARDGAGISRQQDAPYSTASDQIVVTHLGGKAFTEIRRYVVIQEGHGNAICCPIHTYGGQATLKNNLPDVNQHAIIYTSDYPPEEYWYSASDGTEVREQFTKDPIKVRREQNDSEGDLGHLSRLNYSKVYTIEHYVKVLNIGMVEKNWIPALLASSMVRRNSPIQPPARRPPRSSHRDNKDRDNKDRDNKDRKNHHKKKK